MLLFHDIMRAPLVELVASRGDHIDHKITNCRPANVSSASTLLGLAKASCALER